MLTIRNDRVLYHYQWVNEFILNIFGAGTMASHSNADVVSGCTRFILIALTTE